VNTLPLHPAVVHVPLGLALVMPALFAGLLWAVYTNRLPRAAWLVGLVLQGFLLGAALVALRTGEQDEERAEARASEAQVDAHAQSARAFTWAAGATFAAAGLALALRARPRAFAGAGLASVLASLAMLALGVQAGHRGAALVHSAPGMDAPAAPGEADGEPRAATGSSVEHDEDDDD